VALIEQSGLYCEPVPDGRKLYLEDFAELLGVGVKTLTGYRSRGQARLPEPDGYDVEAGHARPYWRLRTAQEYRAARPGRGRWRESRD
jgi:hypothetical protein